MSCRKLDEQVVHPDKSLENVLNKFICVRLTEINDIDLTAFQFDSELSFAAFFLNASGDMYGRYGTRSYKDRKVFRSQQSYRSLGVDNTKDVTIEGFKKAALAALSLHEKYIVDRSISKLFRGKKHAGPSWKTPRKIPAMPKRGCIHCHHIKTYSIVSLKQANKKVLDKDLWSFPMPDSLGFSLDPKEKAKINNIISDSEADTTGLIVNDEIIAINTQPIISIADVQWVLHTSSPLQILEIEILRNNQVLHKQLQLPQDWRRRSKFHWRWRSCRELWEQYTHYSLDLEDVTLQDSTKGTIVVKVFSRKGLREIRPNDVIVDVDGQGPKTASELIAYFLQEKCLGEDLHLTVLRKNFKRKIKIKTFEKK